MNTETAPINELDIMAYADGEFDDDQERKIEIETFLRRNPEHAARVREYLRQDEEIRRVYALDMATLASSRLMVSLLRMRSRRNSKSTFRAILVAATLALGIMAICRPEWAPGRAQSQGRFAAEAVTALRRSSSIDPVSILASSGVVKAETPQTIGFRLKPPHLASEAPLRGDGQNAFSERGEATLVYGRGKQRFVLLIALDPESKGSKISISTKKGLPVAQWRDGSIVCTLVGNLDRSEILRLARRAKRSIELRPFVFRRRARPANPQAEGTSAGALTDVTSAEVFPASEATSRSQPQPAVSAAGRM